MRWLSTPVFACIVATSAMALAQTPPPANTGNEAPASVVPHDDGSMAQDLVEQESRSQRKKNAFLYIVAAGLAAIGTTYTLTRPREESDED